MVFKISVKKQKTPPHHKRSVILAGLFACLYKPTYSFLKKKFHHFNSNYVEN